MVEYGLSIRPGEGMTRIQATCAHQSGLLYVVPAERSWVCSTEHVPAHAVAGFFRELVALKDHRVQELMQLWGIYYRQLPLDPEPPSASTGTDTNLPTQSRTPTP